MAKKKFEFSEERIKYIINNWGIESPHSMKKKFGCTWYAVCKVAEEHGLEIPKSKEWTKEEIEQLKELSTSYNYKEIAKIMNKTENSIYIKARRLGIKLLSDKKIWTRGEEQLLKDLWGNKSIESISKELNRSINSLKVKATRLGLGSMIKSNYSIITISEITDLLNVTRDRITTRWVKLGLKLKKKKLTNNKEYYSVTLDDLMCFLEQNQDEWNSNYLEINALGPEPEWLKEKRKRDLKEEPQFYRKWTEEEITKAEELFKSGKTYEEISVIIKRSSSSVAYLLRNLGYSYRLPCFWKGEELKFLKDNYQNMTHQEIAEVLGRTTKSVGAKAEEMGYQKKKSKKE